MNWTASEAVPAKRVFDWLDYAVFGGMLLVSALIGVYFAFCARRRPNTTSEYLMGGKVMGVFPISMSLIASYISGITLLGMPSEMYMYGTQYWVAVIPEVLVSVTMALVYLPVFYTLQITSSYEYLKLRFNHTVRLLGSILFLIKMMVYIPVVIYVPALAFSQVTGINLHLITPIVCVVCIFYTTLGGLKAVVWTDTLQTVVMFGGVLTVMVLGTVDVGGVSAVLQRSREGDRLEFFNLDLDPRTRHTFWNVCIGNYFSWLASCSVNQAMVQRCLAMPSVRKANVTIMILAVGIVCIVSMSCYTGLVIYATFADCDPITTKVIRKPDQLLPYYVMEIAEFIPALPGLFVAGVFSAALSTMSTGLNSMTGVIFEDLIRPACRTPISEARASLVMKAVVVVIGCACVGLVFLVDQMGTILQAAKSLTGITSGALLGMFSLGMFFPWANPLGALSGGVCGVALVGWISLGTQAAIASRRITFPTKPLSVQGCPHALNSTAPPPAAADPADAFFLFRMSYLWYNLIGTLTVLVVGLAVSFLTGPVDPRDVSRDLLTPVIHRFLPEEASRRHKQNGAELQRLSTGAGGDPPGDGRPT
ncbi:sodium-coupled monocarboxylate transporter 2-like [Bacillus rossius redtenbacheri]|uniref:sodium-coupled monocarboxylate transporter 2-like n=1 Tax=Bacillus rossius redtenbacheri TaxID=93214 RepID=UPI002FDD9DD6